LFLSRGINGGMLLFCVSVNTIKPDPWNIKGGAQTIVATERGKCDPNLRANGLIIHAENLTHKVRDFGLETT